MAARARLAGDDVPVDRRDRLDVLGRPVRRTEGSGREAPPRSSPPSGRAPGSRRPAGCPCRRPRAPFRGTSPGPRGRRAGREADASTPLLAVTSVEWRTANRTVPSSSCTGSIRFARSRPPALVLERHPLPRTGRPRRRRAGGAPGAPAGGVPRSPGECRPTAPSGVVPNRLAIASFARTMRYDRSRTRAAPGAASRRAFRTVTGTPCSSPSGTGEPAGARQGLRRCGTFARCRPLAHRADRLSALGNVSAENREPVGPDRRMSRRRPP